MTLRFVYRNIQRFCPIYGVATSPKFDTTNEAAKWVLDNKLSRTQSIKNIANYVSNGITKQCFVYDGIWNGQKNFRSSINYRNYQPKKIDFDPIAIENEGIKYLKSLLPHCMLHKSPSGSHCDLLFSVDNVNFLPFQIKYTSKFQLNKNGNERLLYNIRSKKQYVNMIVFFIGFVWGKYYIWCVPGTELIKCAPGNHICMVIGRWLDKYLLKAENVEKYCINLWNSNKNLCYELEYFTSGIGYSTNTSDQIHQWSRNFVFNIFQNCKILIEFPQLENRSYDFICNEKKVKVTFCSTKMKNCYKIHSIRQLGTRRRGISRPYCRLDFDYWILCVGNVGNIKYLYTLSSELLEQQGIMLGENTEGQKSFTVMPEIKRPKKSSQIARHILFNKYLIKCINNNLESNSLIYQIFGVSK